ncbi:MAG: DUF739 family protein [Bacilli bacterium]|nr:DUF739 family protein [Bacilli bacterium]
MKTNYDYSKLNGRIVEICGTQANYAKAINLSERSVSLKLNNLRAFTQPEIDATIIVLKLDASNICDYFFKHIVQ